MVDFPNHFVRHVLSVAPADHTLAGFYEFSWALQPNLAADLVMVPLLSALPPLVAAKLATGLALLGWVAAPVVLHRVVWERWAWWPLLAGLVAFNGNLAFGFENYYLTAPIAILAYAGWIATRRAWGLAPAFVVLLVAAFGVYVGHLFGWGILGLAVGSHLLGEVVRSREGVWKRIGTSAVLLAAFIPEAVHFGAGFLFSPIKHGSAETYWYGGLSQKIVALWSPVYTFSQVGDALLAAAVGGLIIAGARRVEVHRDLRSVLVGFAVVSVLMPQTLFGVHFTDIRLPPVLLGLVVAATFPRFSFERVAVGVASVMLIVRSLSVMPVWWRYDQQAHELIEATQDMPVGSSLLIARSDGVTTPLQWQIACYAAAEHGLFVPSMFTGGFLMDVTETYRHLDHPQPLPLPVSFLLDDHSEPTTGPHYWKDWRDNWDYVVVYAPDDADELGLTVVVEGSWFTIYRVEAEYP